jgi:hypothetical protein
MYRLVRRDPTGTPRRRRRARTGLRWRVFREPQLRDPALLFTTALMKAGSLGSTRAAPQSQVLLFGQQIYPALARADYLGFQFSFSPNTLAQFTQNERFAAIYLIHSFTPPTTGSLKENILYTCKIEYHDQHAIAGSYGAYTLPPARTLVFTAVFNTFNRHLEILNIGAPTGNLPAVVTVNPRLTARTIRVQGFSATEDPLIKAGLNLLTNAELDRIRNITISRVAGQGPLLRPGSTDHLGGRYSANTHLIEIWDNAFTAAHYQRRALGRVPAILLPECAHTIIHEVGHALSYYAYVQYYPTYTKARNDVDTELKVGKLNYPAHVQGTMTSYRYANPNSVAANQRTAYNQWLTRMRAAEAALRNAQTRLDASEWTSGLRTFETRIGWSTTAVNVNPITEYCRDERIYAVGLPQGNARGNATQKHQYKARQDAFKRALEEFYAESFALWKWDRTWLTQQRPARRGRRRRRNIQIPDIHGFFDAGSHI